MKLGEKYWKWILHYAFLALWVDIRAESKTLQTSKPHIIFILADDLGWNDVSWHNPKAKTPNLESLAKDGIILEQSYVQAICTPTRSAFLTGRYPFTIGRQRGVLDSLQPTGLLLNATLLPETLKDAGYETHAVGKWHLGFCNWNYTPTYRGFDTFYGYYNGMEDHYTKLAGSHAHLPIINDNGYPDEPPVRSSGYDFHNNKEVDVSVNGTYDTVVYSTFIKTLLKSRKPQDPLFLYFALQSVHSPYQVPDSYREPFQYIEDEDREILLGMAWAMDDAVGEVVDTLKETGHYDNSIIIFSSDNGGAIGKGNNWPLRGGKGTLWEGGMRAPGFIHSPLLTKKGFISNTMLHVTDWYPTLVGLAGGVPPENADGYDMWEALTLEDESPRTYFVYNIDNTAPNGEPPNITAALRKGEYKLIVGHAGNDSWIPPQEGVNSTGHHPLVDMCNDYDGDQNDIFANKQRLFNLIDDPEEANNLAHSHHDVLQDMLEDLNKELKRLAPPDIPPSDQDGSPDNYGGVWSPGWC